MDGSKISAVVEEFPSGIDPATEEEYVEQSKLLEEFTKIPNFDKAWTFKSDSGMISIVFASAFSTCVRLCLLSQSYVPGHVSSISTRHF